MERSPSTFHLFHSAFICLHFLSRSCNRGLEFLHFMPLGWARWWHRL
jgi:hypothetical protein